ncbi:hypothetical protein B7463_g826, partial [Scytalidium lignicola]
MHLINTETFEIREFGGEDVPQYAVLSHTWGEEEVTLQDMRRANSEAKKGYEKVKNFCSIAKADNFEFVWIDTCCIDKTNSTELSEAINSMYRWYQSAEVCYAYLADVSFDIVNQVDNPVYPELSASRWFTRGWTLQELIAPTKLIFLNQHWQVIGTKSDLRQDISEITGIPIRILSGDDALETASVAQRMSWATNRKTSRLEDKAYCLMGIFGINMPPIYGEAENAFIRLQEEIMKKWNDHSIFAWKSDKQNRGGLLATSVDAFKDCADIIVGPRSSIFPNSPWTRSNMGIHVELPFIGIGHRGLGLAILNCTKLGKQDMFVGIYLRDNFLTMKSFDRVQYEKLELVNAKYFRPSQYAARKICVPQQSNDRRHNFQSSNLELFDENLTNFESVIKQPLAIAPMDLTLIDEKELALLSDKAERGQVEEVRLLLAQSDKQTDLSDKHKRTALSYAAKQGDVERVRWLLAQRTIQVDSKDRYGRTPLSYAAQRGHTKVLWLLLAQNNVEANSRDENGRTPLSYAAGGGYDEAVWFLLTRIDVTPHSEDKDGLTPLSHAAKNGHVAVIDIFLAREDTPSHLRDGSGRSPLSYASESGQVAAVEMLLTRYYIESNIRDNNDYNSTPLCAGLLLLAAERGYNIIAKLLLKYDAEIDSRDNEGRTPLLVAVQNKHDTMVKLLLENGAKTVSKDIHGRVSLLLAIQNQDNAAVKLLLKLVKADTESKDDKELILAVKNNNNDVVKSLLESSAGTESRDAEGHTPLLLATRNNNDAIAKSLLESRAGTESRNAEGHTPLLLATRNNNDVIVKLLLQNNADTELKDNTGQNPLLFAAKNGYDNIVKLLLEGGAETESRNAEDQTPLLLAIKNGHEATVALLLESGAQMEAKNNEGQTALLLAVENGYAHVVGLLLKKGANTESRNKESQTPLLLAVDKGSKTMVELLLEGGNDTKLRDLEGRTPLLTQISDNNVDSEYKYSDNESLNPHVDIQTENDVVIPLLPGRGSEIEWTDSKGRSPLLLAAKNGHWPVVKQLLMEGADANWRDNEGKTPLFWASCNGYRDIVKLLLKNGAHRRDDVMGNTKAKIKSTFGPFINCCLQSREMGELCGALLIMLILFTLIPILIRIHKKDQAT